MQEHDIRHPALISNSLTVVTNHIAQPALQTFDVLYVVFRLSSTGQH